MRTAVVGVGNPLRGDDAAGVMVVHGLAHVQDERILLLEGGSAPENVTGLVRKFAPHLVIFVDATDMGHRPGTLRWLDPATTDGFPCGHTMPLSALAAYLTVECGCRVRLLAIQPQELGFGTLPLPVIQRAVQRAVAVLSVLLESR